LACDYHYGTTFSVNFWKVLLWAGIIAGFEKFNYQLQSAYTLDFITAVYFWSHFTHAFSMTFLWLLALDATKVLLPLTHHW
jgi:hypothetical protein